MNLNSVEAYSAKISALKSTPIFTTKATIFSINLPLNVSKLYQKITQKTSQTLRNCTTPSHQMLENFGKGVNCSCRFLNVFIMFNY